MRRLPETMTRSLVFLASSAGLASSLRGPKGAAPGGPEAQSPAVQGAAEGNPAPPPLPSPGRLEDLGAWADSVPVGAAWVALFPAADLLAVIRALPERLPRVVRAIDEPGFLRRIDRTWGIDPGALSGDCVVFGIRDNGIAGLCQGGRPGQASGPRWQEGDAGGILVRNGDREFRVGLLGPEGPAVIGEAAAVAEILAVRRRQVPSIAPVLQRRQKDLRDLAGSDSFRHAALWFLDPSGIPGGADSRLAALFLGPEGFLAVSLAAEGREESLEQALRAWWQGTVESVRRVTGQDPERQDEPGSLGDLFKDADTPLQSGDITLRGDRVFLKGRGNPVWTALAARRDLLDQWFGDRSQVGNP